ncbi:MAG: hypothetical protein MMC33_008224 [Icmadophila ericetorum]|nr:hypothetical protein [Icmadophila ericetorum]
MLHSESFLPIPHPPNPRRESRIPQPKHGAQQRKRRRRLPLAANASLSRNIPPIPERIARRCCDARGHGVVVRFEQSEGDDPQQKEDEVDEEVRAQDPEEGGYHGEGGDDDGVVEAVEVWRGGVVEVGGDDAEHCAGEDEFAEAEHDEEDGGDWWHFGDGRHACGHIW